MFEASDFTALKVAIVHHWFIRRGGAERVVEELAAMFPAADIFALLAAPSAISPALAHRNIRTSFLQRLPGSRRHHRLLMPLFPLALEGLNLSGYDLVISSESGPAKGVLTGANTCHICYCHSPMRYLWEMPHHYRQTVPGGPLGRMIFDLASHYLRIWDHATAARVDHFIANSQNAANRIRKCYRREATIICPPVNTRRFLAEDARSSDSYLVVSRLVSYKRVDLAIEACNRLGRRLIVIGEGEQRQSLEKLADSTVSFLGEVSDEQVRHHLRHCRALLFPGEEDFGLVPVEAHASGRPVIAFGRGGALETVLPLQPGRRVEDATGVFFFEPSADSLVEAMRQFEAVESGWSPARIRVHARQFDTELFRQRVFDYLGERLSLQRRRAVAV